MPKTEYTFKRYEKKFLLGTAQYSKIIEQLGQRMEIDEYGMHTICNIYFDTDNFDLIRTSIEKPLYKEKFRLRSYGIPGNNDNIFAEIKKKFDGIVYKRRIAVKPPGIQGFLDGGEVLHEDFQIQREIHWFLHMYNPVPKVFIAYERVAFTDIEEPGLRITFDQNIRWRTTELDLCAGDEGQLILDDNKVVMEVKLPQAAPMWLASLLSEFKVYPNSFSKYGTCYKQHLLANAFAERTGKLC
ncbi:MAG: polyphosphate polymerase domain-containing protein [Lachnospiraceae bacterium]|nr:polyphosphate polymerase domain-containing protein [Lachnospiraceae bacterium]